MIDLTKYQPRANYQVYPEEYFSGCECSVYFGDAWVDEVVSINFSLLEYVQPIFGYNSYTYDAAARGSRLIQGNFRINFRESFYLHKIIRETKIIGGAGGNWANYSPDRETADDIFFEPSFDAIDKTTITTIKDGKEVSEQLKNRTSEQKAAIAKQLQDLIWDKKRSQGSDENDVFFKQPAQGFTIVILYGNHLDLPKVPDYQRQFDIPASTTITLYGVQLTGQNHVVTPDGQPIYEDYSFIAKDMVPTR